LHRRAIGYVRRFITALRSARRLRGGCGVRGRAVVEGAEDVLQEAEVVGVAIWASAIDESGSLACIT